MTDNEQAAKIRAMREAQKRLAWIENVKRIKGWDQETAEREYTKIFNSQSK